MSYVLQSLSSIYIRYITGHVIMIIICHCEDEKRIAVDVLLLDLDSLPTPLLVIMMFRCNEEIQNGQDNLDSCLMPVVGMLVSVLGTRDVVAEGGEQKSGAEYRDRVSIPSTPYESPCM